MTLSGQNPWWNEGGLWDDPDLIRVRSSKLRYFPKPFSARDCEQPGVLTLRGPRRAGKTVALKLLVADLIENQGWLPRSIAWTALDTLRTLQQMESHLSEIARTHAPKLLLIDEATTVTGWQRVIKKLRDDGTLASVCVILTGSSAHDLKAGAERMAGRRGDVAHPDRVLLPMSFEDFRDQLPDQTHAVQDYLRIGGFPFRVDRFLSGERDDLAAFQVFDDVIFYEFARRKLDRSIAIEVLGRLASIQCSSSSYEGFIKPLTVAKDTARKYLDALGDSFLLATLSSYDTARGRVAPKKERKFVWVDPALGFTGQWLRQSGPADEASRAEWAVGAELLRRHEVRLFEGLSAPRSVFTWKSSGGNELDYLIVDKSRKLLFPVEVKYQRTISDWDFQVLERAFGKGWIVTPGEDRQRPKSEAISLSRYFARAREIGNDLSITRSAVP